MADDNNSIVKQSGNKEPTGGSNVHPENINRNGRPKKGFTLTDIAKEILEEELPTGITRKEALMKKVAQLAYEGNETMIKLLWNYVDGMPTQRNEITGANGEGLKFIIKADGYNNPKHSLDDATSDRSTDRPNEV